MTGFLPHEKQLSGKLSAFRYGSRKRRTGGRSPRRAKPFEVAELRSAVCAERKRCARPCAAYARCAVVQLAAFARCAT